jgi:signal transduction histidine kinase
MMPSTLHKFGLLVALEDLITELNIAAYLKLEFQHYQLDLDLSDEVSLSVYRIIQELLHNAIKHAGATEILLQLVQNDNQLEIVVEDNGKGYDVKTSSMGSGLMNIQSRLLYLNGEMKIDAGEGNGVSISIEIPLHELVITNQK